MKISDLRDFINKIPSKMDDFQIVFRKFEDEGDYKNGWKAHNAHITQIKNHMRLPEAKLWKKEKLDGYTQSISEISKSIEETKYINEQPIEEAKKEWDILKGEINNTERYIALVEQSLESNKEKLTHLAQHEYDPNCNFCMNNVFVKDAKETEKKVEEQIADLEEMHGKLNSLINQN